MCVCVCAREVFSKCPHRVKTCAQKYRWMMEGGDLFEMEMKGGTHLGVFETFVKCVCVGGGYQRPTVRCVCVWNRLAVGGGGRKDEKRTKEKFCGGGREQEREDVAVDRRK